MKPNGAKKTQLRAFHLRITVESETDSNSHGVIVRFHIRTSTKTFPGDDRKIASALTSLPREKFVAAWQEVKNWRRKFERKVSKMRAFAYWYEFCVKQNLFTLYKHFFLNLNKWKIIKEAKKTNYIRMNVAILCSISTLCNKLRFTSKHYLHFFSKTTSVPFVMLCFLYFLNIIIFNVFKATLIFCNVSASLKSYKHADIILI